MKLFFILIMLFSTNYFSQEIIPGCEGEGCGCTKESKTNKKMILYEKMDTNSKVIKTYKAKTKAKLKSSFIKIIKKGKYKITKVTDSSLEVKIGQEFNELSSEGEGYFSATINGKNISFNYEQIEYETLEDAKKEYWHQISVGGKLGYTNIFPFLGCLE